MKTWWDILLEKNPKLEKYPGSLAKTQVLLAEKGDTSAQQWMKEQNLWYPDFESFSHNC